MKTESELDEIRAGGFGVSLEDGPIPKCENCQRSRSMDDLHRIQIAYLGEEIERHIGVKCELRGVADRQYSRIKTLHLVIWGLSIACVFLGLDSAGYFKP